MHYYLKLKLQFKNYLILMVKLFPPQHLSQNKMLVSLKV